MCMAAAPLPWLIIKSPMSTARTTQPGRRHALYCRVCRESISCWRARLLRRQAWLTPTRGDLVAVSEEDSWFSYYYWLDSSQEPDFAHTIDIHRKPGYDPLEMFIDPDLAVPLLRVARRLTQKKLGMRYLMDVIPVDKDLVRGSHGRLPQEPEQGPVWISSASWDAGNLEPEGGVVSATDVRDRMLGLMGLS